MHIFYCNLQETIQTCIPPIYIRKHRCIQFVPPQLENRTLSATTTAAAAAVALLLHHLHLLLPIILPILPQGLDLQQLHMHWTRGPHPMCPADDLVAQGGVGDALQQEDVGGEAEVQSRTTCHGDDGDDDDG